MKIVVSLIMVSPKFGEINCFSCPVESPHHPPVPEMVQPNLRSLGRKLGKGATSWHILESVAFNISLFFIHKMHCYV